MSTRVANDIAWRQVAGETFVIDLRRKMMYGLNETGGAVWQAIVAGESRQAMLEALAGVTGHDDAAAQPALECFLADLGERGLVTGIAATVCQSLSDEPPFVPPQVSWSEEVRAFALSCLLQAGPCSDPGPPQEAV